jgi:serine/threonine protein kinase
MSLAAGVRLGPYEIVAVIGAGGMGEVYRARDARLGRDVAVKVLPPAFTSDPDRASVDRVDMATGKRVRIKELRPADIAGVSGDRPSRVAARWQGVRLRLLSSARAAPRRDGRRKVTAVSMEAT